MASFKKKYESLMGRKLTHSQFSDIQRMVKAFLTKNEIPTSKEKIDNEISLGKLKTSYSSKLQEIDRLVDRHKIEVIPCSEKDLYYAAGNLEHIGGWIYTQVNNRAYTYLAYKISTSSPNKAVLKTIKILEDKINIHFCKSKIKDGTYDYRITRKNNILRFINFVNKYCYHKKLENKAWKIGRYTKEVIEAL